MTDTRTWHEKWQAKERYQQYLQSDWWRWRRGIAILRAHGRCEKCQREDHLEVHHRNYERRGRERHEDLQVLCAVCHGDLMWEKRPEWIRTAPPVWDGPTHIGEIVPYIFEWMVGR